MEHSVRQGSAVEPLPKRQKTEPFKHSTVSAMKPSDRLLHFYLA